MNANDFIPVIVMAGMFLGAIVSGRIAYFLAKKWEFGKNGERKWFTGFGAVAAFVLMGFGIYALIFYAGVMAGLLGLLLEIPLIGFFWVATVGSAKAVEQVLANLLKKIN